RRFQLPFGYALEAGPVHLGAVGRIMHAQGDDARHERRHAQTPDRQQEEQKIQLHEQRCAADELDQKSHRPRNDFEPGAAADSKHQSEHHGHQHAQHGSLYRYAQRLDQQWRDFPGVLPIEDHERVPLRRATLRSSARTTPVITRAVAKYSNSTRLKISRVRSVSARSNWARNVRSAIVISDTNAVFFSNSISRLPVGGNIAAYACGRMM